MRKMLSMAKLEHKNDPGALMTLSNCWPALLFLITYCMKPISPLFDSPGIYICIHMSPRLVPVPSAASFLKSHPSLLPSFFSLHTHWPGIPSANKLCLSTLIILFSFSLSGTSWPALLWFVSRCPPHPREASSGHRWGFQRWLNLRHVTLELKVWLLNQSADLFGTTLSQVA